MVSADDRIVEALGNHHAHVGSVSGNWLCKCGEESTNGTIRDGDLTTSMDRCRQHDQHLAEVIEPIIKAREAEALREALREAVLNSRMVPDDPALRVLFEWANEIEARP